MQPKATTLNQAYSQWTGYQGEIGLANTVAGLGETVVRWGDSAGTNGSDVASVSPNSAAVTLWDNKYRSASTSMGQSTTFESDSARANAVEQAKAAIGTSSLPDSIKQQAIDNLDKGNFVTNTVGSGGVKNSTQVRYCGNKPC